MTSDVGAAGPAVGRVAAAFDLDGTLVDLAVDIATVRAAVAGLFADRGYRGAFAPILPAIDAAAAAVARDADERRRLVERAHRLIDEAEVAAARRARPRPGARAALEALCARGWPLGLVTDNGGACVAPALAAAGLPARFAAVVSRDDVARPKPAPDGLVAVARALLPAGGTLFYVGDSPRDVVAGHDARGLLPGIDLVTIAVTSGRGRAEDLAAAGPDRTIRDLAALLTVVA
jgi:phosphoglycolate phosphatase-like HAD superfamily hydrolase